jgi:hypothetical protein
MSSYNRDAGSIEESTNKEKMKAAFKADPVLTALYQNRYVDITPTVVANIDNAAFKLAMLKLAWILIRRLTK